MTESFDVLVVGAGPTGLACGIELQNRGVRTVLVEKGCVVNSLRNKWKSAVVVLASTDDSGVSIVSAVTKDLTAKVHAGKLVGAVAQAVGGKGGGRPDMAEGGGKDAGALDAALESIYTEIAGKL